MKHALEGKQSARVNIRTMASQDLANWLELHDEPTFRAKQIYDWLWVKGADNFGAMSNLPQSLRSKMQEGFAFNIAQPDVVQKSQDGTIKVGFTLFDQRTVEGVIIPTSKRITACISSQVGCSLACSFCATGKMKRIRNLTSGEIYDQVVMMNKKLNRKYLLRFFYQYALKFYFYSIPLMLFQVNI